VKRRGLDDEARRAEAALQGVVRHEGLLHRVQFCGADAFDRRHGFVRRGAAGIRQLTTGAPSTSTVQAPQTPAPHTSLVPVRSRSPLHDVDQQRIGIVGQGNERPLIVIVLICDLQVLGTLADGFAQDGFAGRGSPIEHLNRERGGCDSANPPMPCHFWSETNFSLLRILLDEFCELF
jgi:hypothetical protein